MSKITWEKVGPENLSDCGIGCLTDPKNQGYRPKVEWLQERFPEGLRFLLFRDEENKPLAFLEYVPGEYAWRPVDCEGWVFVHCLWVYSRGQKVGGLGSRLVQACLAEARQEGAISVAAMVSEGPWMIRRQVFLNNGLSATCRQATMEDYKSRPWLRSWPLPAESLSDFSTPDITLAETPRTTNGLP
jgi:hypothetical protein